MEFTMVTASQTLRDITGMGYQPAVLKDSAYKFIDDVSTAPQETLPDIA